MSGMELVGFVIGVLGPVEQSINLINDIKNRLNTDKKNGPILARLVTRLTEFQAHLYNLRESYDGKVCLLESATHASFLLSEKESLDNVEADITRAEASLAEINTFLAVAEVTQKATLHETKVISQIIDKAEGNINSVVLQEGEKISRQIGKLPGNIASTRLPPDTFNPSFHVPENPPHVELDYDTKDSNCRPATFEGRLKESVLQRNIGRFVGILDATAGAVGMGGTGKTCALKGLAHEADVQARFTDGIYYLSLGMNADRKKVASQLRKIVQVSSGIQTGARMERFENMPDTLDAVIGETVAWFKGKDCLFLIDDMWEENDLDAGTLTQLSQLAKCSEKSTVAFTTRSETIARLGDGIKFQAWEVHGTKAWQNLLRCAGFQEKEIKEDTRKAVIELLTICAGLPVAHAIVGSTVRCLSKSCEPERERAWFEYLYAYESPGQHIVRRRIDGYESLKKTIVLSLKILEANCKGEFTFSTPLSIPEMFRALCVFRKQERIGPNSLYRLWNLKTPAEATVVARHFEELSLTTLEKSSYGDELHWMQLHDLVHDVVCAYADENEGAPFWHSLLLDGFISHNAASRERGCRSWWECWHDFDNNPSGVERQLREAGLDEELLELGKTPRWAIADHQRPFMGAKLSRITFNFCVYQRITDSTLSVVGTERSERAVRCVRDITDALTNLLCDVYTWHCEGNDDWDWEWYVGRDGDYNNKVHKIFWLQEWEKSLDHFRKAFQAGEHPYSRES